MFAVADDPRVEIIGAMNALVSGALWSFGASRSRLSLSQRLGLTLRMVLPLLYILVFLDSFFVQHHPRYALRVNVRVESQQRINVC